MDATQLLLSIMIFLLGVTLTVIGIQFYFILKELKKSIEKTNLMLDDVHIFTKNLAEGSQQLQNLAAILRVSTHEFTEKLSGPLSTGLAVFGLVKGIMEKLGSRKAQKSDRSVPSIDSVPSVIDGASDSDNEGTEGEVK